MLCKYGKGPQVAERIFQDISTLNSFCNDVTRKHRFGNATVRFSFSQSVLLTGRWSESKVPLRCGISPTRKTKVNVVTFYKLSFSVLRTMFASVSKPQDSLIYCLFFKLCCGTMWGWRNLFPPHCFRDVLMSVDILMHNDFYRCQKQTGVKYRHVQYN